MALGKTNRIINELGKLMSELRNTLEQIVADDRAGLEGARNEEKDARVALVELEKKLLGWKGQLADTEEAYLNAANEVNQWLQRGQLVEFIQEMLKGRRSTCHQLAQRHPGLAARAVAGGPGGH